MTFFSEKGGVGKSTFTVLYASYLRYKHGVKVGVADFNGRLESLRMRERHHKEQLGVWDAFRDTDPWPIAAPTSGEDLDLIFKYNGIDDDGYVVWARKEVMSGALKDLDVLLLDFPGSLSGGEFLQFLSAGWIGLTVMPTDRDPMTLETNMRIHINLDEIGHNHVTFINQIKTSISKDIYTSLKDDMQRHNFRVLPDMVSASERIRKIDEVSIIRSTYEYPDWGLKCFSGNRDLGIENLFTDISRELAKTPDLPDTGTAGLPFVKTLEKIRNDSRQLTGTLFPEYEMNVLY